MIHRLFTLWIIKEQPQQKQKSFIIHNNIILMQRAWRTQTNKTKTLYVYFRFVRIKLFHKARTKWFASKCIEILFEFHFTFRNEFKKHLANDFIFSLFLFQFSMLKRNHRKISIENKSIYAFFNIFVSSILASRRGKMQFVSNIIQIILFLLFSRGNCEFVRFWSKMRSRKILK